VSCVNGHENPDGQYFCGQCGDQLEPTVVICAAGHANADDQRFCGECGAPLAAPPGVEQLSATARWSVDPTGRHQYRYWEGDRWTRHVADRGHFGADRPPKASGRLAESVVALVAGFVTLGLLLGAAADIWVQLSRDAAKRSGTAQSATPQDSTTPSPSEEASAPSPTESAPQEPPGPQEPPEPRPLAVIATPCLPGSSNGTTADGSVSYCERLQDTDTYFWSLYPGDIPNPRVEDGSDPTIEICMVQTLRTEPDCLEYLKRPSDPGDGRPVT